MIDGRKLRGDRSRDVVVDQGVRLATIKGLHGFSIGELAEQSGIAKANISVLFGSKADLHVAITNCARSRFTERVVDPIRSAPPGLAQLLALGESWFTYLSDPTLIGGCFFSAAMFELDAQPGSLRDTIRADMEAWLQAITAIIADAQRLGEVRKGVDATEKAIGFFSLGVSTNALIQLGIANQPALRARRVWRDAVNDLAAKPSMSAKTRPTTRKATR
jgi:AcrR family transcriptional regulator